MEKLKQDITNYQINSIKNYDVDKYNQYQNYLYKRALYGLSSLDQNELITMCNKKKSRIINVYKRAQIVLNIYKQKVTNSYSNFIFKTLFPNSPITDFLISESDTDYTFKNTLTFKDLGINKDDIISIFISEGILPKNFLSLETNPYQLPKLKNEN